MSDSDNGTSRHWEQVTLHEIAEVRLGRQRSPKRATGDHMRPYMRAANVTWEGISLHDIKEMDFTPAEYKVYGLKSGDILLAEASGSASEVGKPALWRNQVANCCFQNTLIRVRAPEELVPFLHLHFMKDARTGAFASASRGVGIHHLGAQALSEWQVVVPPLPEQHRIVEAIESYFTRLDDAVATLERVQRNLKRYRASVLKAAVEGRLVPTEAELAKAEGRDLPAPRPNAFFVYAIECNNDSIYIGQTQDLPKRWKEHLSGQGADWTTRHPPRRVVHWEEFDSRDAAVEREKHLKTGFGRKWLKRELAAGRTRQAGYEPASALLERILVERRRRWEEAELAKMKANGKPPNNDKWKAKYKEPTAPDTTGLPELPEGWCWASVDQLGSVSGGLTQNSKRTRFPLQLPFLRVANVYANELRLDEVKKIGVTEPEVERVLLQLGDLLVVEGNGSLDQIGRVAVWDASIQPCLHQNHLIKVRFCPASLGQWSLSWLLSPGGRRAIEKVASSTSGLHTLSLSKVGMLPLPLCPLAEQSRITAEVERLLTIAEAAGQAVLADSRRCARLRQAILKWAFEGKLADQDPTDEPASVLLERIKAEREANGHNKPNATRRPRSKNTCPPRGGAGGR